MNGIIALSSIRSTDVLLNMNQPLAHRLPIKYVSWDENQVALSEHLLTNHLTQPTVSACGRFVLVMSGHIYNYLSLKSEYQYPYIHGNDREVLLAAWSKHGAQIVERFKGSFAFAVWDREEEMLSLVRDRMGEQPLFWAKNSVGFLFSSELRRVVASNVVDSELSQEVLVDYLRYQTVQAPHTILKEVKMVSPASILQYKLKSDTVSIHKYWNLSTINKIEVGSYEEIKSEVHKLFYQSVEKSLAGDGTSGAFLSGGIDSSAVVGALAKRSSSPINTFNVSFAEEEFSEAKYARHIAQLHNTNHTEIQLSPQQFLEFLPQALGAMDHPSGDGPNTWVVSKLTKEAGVDIAFSGLGGDELFGGYAIFNRLFKLNKFRGLWQLPVSLRKVAGEMLKRVRPSVASSKMSDLLSFSSYNFNEIYSVSRQVLLDGQIQGLLNNPILPTHYPVLELEQLGWDNRLANHLLSRVSVAEMNGYMQNVLLRDSFQMGMAHGLEIRTPFMDHELVNYVLSLPDSIKFPSTPKKLLVDSFPDLLPSYIVDRPKMGFSFPWDSWLRNELNSYADERIRELAKWELFNEKGVISLWQGFLKGDPKITFSRIWPLVVLAEWKRNL